MRARVRVPAGEPGPGQLCEVELEAAEISGGCLRMPGLDVADVGLRLTDRDDLLFDPCDGGGPLGGPEQRLEARAFGIVNVAFHVHRGLVWAAELLGSPLPRLVVRIGAHAAQRPAWAGGHYRLPAEAYSDLPEPSPVTPTGEIHLGYGGSYLRFQGRRYFDAPSHNPAIVFHELGHHLCRHLADFRLNERRPAMRQANRKIPLDEGTSDYVAATLLGYPDIFGWHRGEVPSNHPGRRRLDVRRTMASFRGGSSQDPHTDGAVWAAALWSARTATQAAGHPARSFDQLLLDSLRRIGGSDAGEEWNEALRRRRHYARALARLLAAAEERRRDLVGPIEEAFARHGIHTRASNRELRDEMRECELVGALAG